MGSFTSLVFSTFGGIDHAAAVLTEDFLPSLFRRSPVMLWLCCRISYSLLCCAICV